jgi:hypothetical protein
LLQSCYECYIFVLYTDISSSSFCIGKTDSGNFIFVLPSHISPVETGRNVMELKGIRNQVYANSAGVHDFDIMQGQSQSYDKTFNIMLSLITIKSYSLYTL